jgi:archaellum component FlaG (FlaF/FlaG flagellin family)
MGIRFLWFIPVLLISLSVNAEDNLSSNVAFTEMNAKMAQMKARMRAYEVEQDDATNAENGDNFSLPTLGSNGCDINVGNVVLDGSIEAPREVTVLIDGDIIQSNNCR